MKDKDTIEKILTDNANLDMETLEKINDTCCALSDKQKDRILDIINQKTIDKEQTKDIINTTESEDSVKIITYRRNHMKLIISAVACICLLVGTGLFGKLSDNNITQKKNPKETSNTSASTTTITDTTSKYVTTTQPEPTVTTPSASTLPPVTVIETVLETTTTTPVVTTTTAPATTTAPPETSAIPQSIKNSISNELINLKEYYLSQGYRHWGVSYTGIDNSTLNSEQKDILSSMWWVTNFGTCIDELMYSIGKEHKSDSTGYTLTGISYDSLKDFIHLFFAENGTFNEKSIYEHINQICKNDNGELSMRFGVYTNFYPIIKDVVIEESTDSYIKFNLILAEEVVNTKDLPPSFLEKFPDTNTAVQKLAELLQTPAEGYKHIEENIEEVIITDKGDILFTHRITEEMIKTSEGWRFSNYNEIQGNNYTWYFHRFFN